VSPLFVTASRALPTRRRWLSSVLLAMAPGCSLGAATGVASGTPPAPSRVADQDPVRRGRPLVFPRDHGAHLGTQIEWWYATGWLGTPQAPTHGVQVTFFRTATGLAQDVESRFAARHLLFAHAAVTDLKARHHWHDQRIARWSGRPGAALAYASVQDADLRLGNWSLTRQGERWLARLPARDFELQLDMTRTQPLLLQGDLGFSRKGPQEEQASHYYSEPQLALVSQLRAQRSAAGTGPRGGTQDMAAGNTKTLAGRAWLDHEWSQQLLHPEAVGWDWIGMNLFDGTALTAFVLRRANGSALWAGGSLRPPGSATQSFAHNAVQMNAGRIWRSPSSGASYPVGWTLTCPAGAFEVRALMDAQELDSRQSTGTVYWEGLSELLNDKGERVGLGYLEMTGYAGRLRLG
jgi:predicted secreted hydrolase